jgi:DNA-binding NarL/FixJ family response regulator
MLRIVLATTRPEALRSFTEALASDPEAHLEQVASGAGTLDAVRSSSPHLVVIDSYLPDTEPLGLVRKLLMVNAMVNTAIVSPLSDEEFHETSEGLGVLGRLPLEPGLGEAADLLHRLRKVIGRIRG